MHSTSNIENYNFWWKNARLQRRCIVSHTHKKRHCVMLPVLWYGAVPITMLQHLQDLFKLW